MSKFLLLTTYIEDNDEYKADESGLLTKSHWSEVKTLINLNEVLWFFESKKAPVGTCFAQLKNGHKLSIKEPLEEILRLQSPDQLILPKLSKK